MEPVFQAIPNLFPLRKDTALRIRAKANTSDQLVDFQVSPKRFAVALDRAGKPSLTK